VSDTTTYWAVLLDTESVAKLFSTFPPEHPNIYAEHMTIIYDPSDEDEQNLAPLCGTKVNLEVIGYSTDTKGQAVVVSGMDRIGGGIPHITISCSQRVKPFYSNKLLSNGYEDAPPVSLSGIVARYTSQGWDITCDLLKE